MTYNIYGFLISILISVMYEGVSLKENNGHLSLALLGAALMCLSGCGTHSQTAAPTPVTAVEEMAAPADTAVDTAISTETTEIKENTKMEVAVTELTVPNGDRTVYGKLYAPTAPGKYPAIILSHGYNGTNADFVRECRNYAAHGYVAYALDFCGGSVNSKSSGSSTDMTITSEKEDLLAVFDYIKAMDNVDSSNMILFGGSQGGLVSALVAAERADEIKALAMYFPAFCVPDDWEKKYKSAEYAPETFDFWGLKLGRGFVADAQTIDVFGTIGDFKGDVLILHGDKDEIVPYSYSERAIETYEHAELIKLEGEGHGFSMQGGQTAKEKVLEFLDKETK
ncbi:MAG TPA: cinnamoyl ester hydrolase [Ruminococcaceae bacterium]|nr:cinnamoyl ester hydrolase [Oscillospiraceae bacterium]